ncbi:MAG: VWA domain-containing protein [Pirellulales bacterium]
MNVTRELTFDTSPAILLAGCLAVVLVAALSAYAWRRSGYDRRVGVLELLRVILAAMAAITLAQPEWKETYEPTQRPVLAVLTDGSASMDTRDVMNGGGVASGSGDQTISRATVISQELGKIDWTPLQEKIDLVRESFAATPGTQSAPPTKATAVSPQDSAAAAVTEQDGQAEKPAAAASVDRMGTDINSALNRLLSSHTRLRAVVLASDGDWNMGEAPATAATRLRVSNVPVFVVPVGSDEALPDIEVMALEPPTFSVVGKSLQIPFSLRSTLAVDYPVEVTLTVGGGTQMTRQVVVPAKGQVRDVFFWTPEDVGDVDISLSVPVHPQEVLVENNKASVTVGVRAESIRILVVESVPRWEYRYLRNALERDPGVEVSCLLFHPGLSKPGGGANYLKEFPPTPEELSRYDVVILGDVGVVNGQLTAENCSQLRGLVEKQASGLVFMPGMRGYQQTLMDTELNDLYPVVLDTSQPAGIGTKIASQVILTEMGETSLLTKLADTPRENAAVWRGLPGFQWRAAVLRAKAGSDVLAVHEQSRSPLLVTKTFGTGKILFMGTDGAWRWREGVEDKYHYRFWGQVARWMAYQRHMAEGEFLRMFYSPDRPSVGNTVLLNVTVLDPSGAPFKEATVLGELTDPQGGVQKLRFQPTGAEWGLYTARFSPSQVGDYRLALKCTETAAVLDTSIRVQGQQREQVGKPARPEVLQEIAKITRGRVVEVAQLSDLRDEILRLPPPEPEVRRTQIWASPWWASIFLGLLGIFWVGRKAVGAI